MAIFSELIGLPSGYLIYPEGKIISSRSHKVTKRMVNRVLTSTLSSRKLGKELGISKTTILYIRKKRKECPINRQLKPYKGKTGYLVVNVKCNGKIKLHYLHRILAQCFIPNPYNKPQVNHKDGNKLNNSLNNLEWCTDRENKLHAHRTGLNPRTEKGKQASRKSAYKMILARRRFTDKQVADIKNHRLIGKTYRLIADIYGCDHSTILNICKGNSYQKSMKECKEIVL